MKNYFLYKWEIYKNRNGEKQEAPIESLGSVSEEELRKIVRGYKETKTEEEGIIRYTRLFSKYFYEAIEQKTNKRTKQ